MWCMQHSRDTTGGRSPASEGAGGEGGGGGGGLGAMRTTLRSFAERVEAVLDGASLAARTAVAPCAESSSCAVACTRGGW